MEPAGEDAGGVVDPLIPTIVACATDRAERRASVSFRLFDRLSPYWLVDLGNCFYGGREADACCRSLSSWLAPVIFRVDRGVVTVVDRDCS
jgi:hypothetical protein